MYLCSVCGYDRLEDPPKNFTICPSWGTEFGYDDAFASSAELRAKWLRNGAQWWSTVDPKPEHWDPRKKVDVRSSSPPRAGPNGGVRSIRSRSTGTRSNRSMS